MVGGQQYKKIVFFLLEPLTAAVDKKYCITKIRERAFNVEIVYIGTLYGVCRSGYEEMNSSILELSSIRELENYIRIQDVNYTLFCPTFNYHSLFLSFYHLLAKYHVKTLFYLIGIVPTPQYTKRVNLKYFFNVLSIRRIRFFLINRCTPLFVRIGYIRIFDYVFAVGEKTIDEIEDIYKLITKRSKIININDYDYETIREAKKEKALEENQYIVFIDQYIPFHPDSKIVGAQSIDPEKYYNALNRFFDEVEYRYNLPVVIAAHPAAKEYENANYYNDRKIYSGKTASLVKYSSFVLMHQSTSLAFIIACDRRVVFFITDEMIKVYPLFHISANFLAHFLGLKTLNIDKDFFISLPQINQDIYDKYKRTYLYSMETKGRNNIDIISNFLKSNE